MKMEKILSVQSALEGAYHVLILPMNAFYAEKHLISSKKIILASVEQDSMN